MVNENKGLGVKIFLLGGYLSIGRRALRGRGTRSVIFGFRDGLLRYRMTTLRQAVSNPRVKDKLFNTVPAKTLAFSNHFTAI